MKYPVYSIRDLKSDWFHPRIEVNEASAKRSFAMMVNESGTIMNQFSQDYELYHIGEFDTETGVLTPLKMNVLICRGSEMVGVK